MSESETLKNIHNAAMREFSEKGFQGASLRQIVKKAGVTTGAFYGYYNSKEELFDAIVGKHAEYFISVYNEHLHEFESYPKDEQPGRMGIDGNECMIKLYDYTLEHFDEVQLLIRMFEGTKYENFLNEFVDMEIDSTHRFMEVLKELGHEVPDVDERCERMIVQGQFASFFDILSSGLPREEAVEFIRLLNDFYSAGWARLMGM